MAYFDEGLEALVFGQEVFVEVYCFTMTTAEPSIDPFHGFPVGSRELESEYR